jgi:hypothetical protein
MLKIKSQRPLVSVFITCGVLTVLQPHAFYNIEGQAREIDNLVKMSTDPLVSGGIREYSAISGLVVQNAGKCPMAFRLPES